MAEFVIRLADERGHVQEQVQSAATADELRTRFTQAGYYVYSVKPRGLTGGARKTKLETFLIFNQQFLTLIRAGLPILGSLEMLAKAQKNANFRRTAAERGGAGKNGRADFVGVRGAGRISADVHDDAAGRGAVRESGRGAGAVFVVPADFAGVPEEADGVADLSGGADHDGDAGCSFS